MSQDNGAVSRLKSIASMTANTKEDKTLDDLVPIFLEKLGEEHLEVLISTKEIKLCTTTLADQSLVNASVDLFARRFLRAEKYHLEKAVKRAREHASWRLTAIPRGFIVEVGTNCGFLLVPAHWSFFLYLGVVYKPPVCMIDLHNHAVYTLLTSMLVDSCRRRSGSNCCRKRYSCTPRLMMGDPCW